MQRTNDLGQPIGTDLPHWQGSTPLPHRPMHGRTCDLVPVTMDHATDLFQAYSADETGAVWTYMPVGPFDDQAAYEAWLQTACDSRDPLFFTIIDKTNNRAIGTASFLRMQPETGVVEVGFIAFSPALQQTVMATEAMYLMMKRAFSELGYRRYEWKCDALNQPSQAAAKRLGFTFEGIFRQATIYKGRNRDTAWLSILDHEWPRINAAISAWLDPSNFDDGAQQKQRLADLM